jgi:hypothetical protein
VTKVIPGSCRCGLPFCLLLVCSLAAAAVQSPKASENAPSTAPGPAAQGARANSAENLFLELGSVSLDASRIYRIRDVSLDRAAFHITLDDGVIGFTSDVAGRVTGALFEGEGEILLTPPNQVERASLMLQTGAAILEERFASGYFRFNDDTYTGLLPLLTPAENSADFTSRWSEAARILAQVDALRLFMTFARSLPSNKPRETMIPPAPAEREDRFLHARLEGRTKGTFDVYFDSNAPEQVWAAQARTVNTTDYYDVWTSFSFLPSSPRSEAANSIATEEGRTSAIDITACKVQAEIVPPTRIEAEAVLDLQVRQGGQRAVLFELARTLVIKRVEADGQPVEFIHNPSIEGTQLARRGNDLVAVVLAQAAKTGQRIELRFVYGGDVLSEAGPGLLYVGARGTWYPNRGLAMTNFDLQFRYPPGWTLVATGKRVDKPEGATSQASGMVEKSLEQMSRWVSERPIPFAGFNLGKYRRAEAQSGDVKVEAYGTAGVERGFPQPEAEATVPAPPPLIGGAAPALAIRPEPPSPARNAQMVAETAAQAIDFYSRRFGPYPLSDLALTQMPGNLSQGWPGLIFLSSLSFLNAEEKSALHFDPVEQILIGSVVPHETAHQWWGDLVTWSDYRDQWISEALANYSSMMFLESMRPREFREVMAKYRDDLLQKNESGLPLMEDGPVTLGHRLSCSQFPDGYVAVSYGRGTWLFHMLRTMMRDAAPAADKRVSDSNGESEPFVRALRQIRDRYQGKPMTTREMLRGFEEELPRSLWYEGHKSLDWFYEGWVNGTAIPHFELRGLKYTDEPGKTRVAGTILQKDAPADLVTPVPLFASRDGRLSFLGRVFADGPETPFHLSAPAGTRKIIVDPNQTLLARMR